MRRRLTKRSLVAAAFVAAVVVTAFAVPAPWTLLALGFLLAVGLSYAVGARRRRFGKLALGGGAVVGVLILLAFAFGCPDDARECSPWLTVLLSGFILAGWLGGVVVAAIAARILQPSSSSSESQGVR
jgi:hypothetical protein